MNVVGRVNAANQWFGAQLWWPYLIAQSVMPIRSERIGASDRARSAKVVIAALNVTTLVTLPLVLIGSLCARYVMGGYGTELLPTGPLSSSRS